MNRSSESLKDLGLTGFLVVAFLLAGCWARTEESKPEQTKSTPSASSESATPDAPAESAAEKSTTSNIVLTAAETAKPADKAAERVPEPMLKDWKTPKAAIVLSGEQNGYLEPCGCSAMQSGGFARRGDLFAQLKDKKWPVAAFDLGGTLKRSRRQDILKFEKIVDGFNIMHYQALGLGPAELRLGADQLLALHQPEKGLGFVSCNVVFFGAADIGTPLPFKIVEVNGVKIGVTSVLGNFYRDQVIPRENNDPNQPISVSDPITSTKAVLEKMKAEKPDLLVLLSYSKVDETKALATAVPGFDAIITAGGPEEPIDTTEQVGKSILVQVGGKGKHVAILGYYPDDPKQKLKYELINLDRFRFKNLPRMEQLMAEFQERLTDENLSESEKRIAHDSGNEYVGAQKCGECHKKAFAKWKTTKHAQAYESLITGRPDYEGKWVARNHDMECLACHVTGWDPREVVPFETGFVSLEKTPHLKGQQCENCHGPGSDHVKQEELFKKTRRAQDPLLIKARQKIHLDEAMVQKETGCYKCHDGDNSPKFKFADYYKLISHKGLKD
ncbi:MAG: multiheme c-type cytochrome [Planctomycetota bacterium]